MWTFKKTVKTVTTTLQPKKSEQEIIEEIHDTFEGAADAALAEAKKILSQHIDADEKQMAMDLIKLGFDSSALATKMRTQQKEIEAQKVRANIVMKWQVEYPQYKLIFLDQVEKICKKYGLVIGASYRYIGDIPKKNVQEMLDFKIKPQHQLYREGGRSNELYAITKQSYRISNSAYDEARNGIIQHQPCPFFICAPAKDMRINDSEKIEGTQIVQKDPIVLMPIEPQGTAFLIVTKWGLEGNDASLVNEIKN